MTHDAVDGFAGPGGWDVAAAELGLDVLGIEWDDDAVATRRSVGHPTLQADVAALEPRDFGPVRGGIFSPPCPSFSMGGKGLGRGVDVEMVVDCALRLEAGRDEREAYRERCDDERSILTVEPVRWVLALEPEWIALEQVPPVLPIWRVFAGIFERMGYSVWTGELQAERYGVPQTRKRAILMASRTKRVHPPRPTHQEYVSGEPKRHEVTLEGEILPWISMAEALGWGMTERPYPAIACSSTSGGPDMEKVGGSGARAQIYEEQAAGRWKYNARDQKCGKTGNPNRMRSADEPAPTIAGESRNDSWVHERPATTVAGDPRIFPPGHKINGDDIRAGRSGQQRSGAGERTAHNRKRSEATAVRVSIEEAGVLQSFPADYPWQGTKSAQFRQVGNAVPPLLARAVLQEVIG